jgi:hypothetical protein
MIVFELMCAGKHRFEGWFASGSDFDSQHGRGLIECPRCGSDSVEKLPTARIRTSSAAEPAVEARPASVPALQREKPPTLNEMIDFVLKNTEDVGGRFAEEARRMHNEEVPGRAIRGTATGEQARELLDEGIPVLPLPVPPREEWQ